MTAQPSPDWHAADAAYQLHHANCPTCRAAGAAPGSVQRCTVGAQLWATYLKRAFCTAVVKNPRTLECPQAPYSISARSA